MRKTTAPAPARQYRAAAYARLSDGDDALDASNSIVNQVAMIRDHADARDDLEVVGEYADDGYSARRSRGGPPGATCSPTSRWARWTVSSSRI